MNFFILTLLFYKIKKFLSPKSKKNKNHKNHKVTIQKTNFTNLEENLNIPTSPEQLLMHNISTQEKEKQTLMTDKPSSEIKSNETEKISSYIKVGESLKKLEKEQKVLEELKEGNENDKDLANSLETYILSDIKPLKKENNIYNTVVKTESTTILPKTNLDSEKPTSNLVSNSEPDLIKFSDSQQTPIVSNSFEISKKQTINSEEELVKNWPEVPTNNSGKKIRKNTKSRKDIQLTA